jgi:hypothetical protein
VKPELRSVPRLVLSLSSLVQPVRATRDRQLEVASRFKESESLAVALVKAVAVGAEAILVPPTNDVREALGELDKDLPLLVRTPHTPVADDLRWESSLSLEPGDENGINWTPAKAGAAAMNLLPLSMAADLASRVWPRIERDLSTFSAKSISGVVLPPSVTDLALATQKPRVFERLIKAGRLKAGRVGFETYNLGHLLDAFVAWGFAPDFVMGAGESEGRGHAAVARARPRAHPFGQCPGHRDRAARRRHADPRGGCGLGAQQGRLGAVRRARGSRRRAQGDPRAGRRSRRLSPRGAAHAGCSASRFGRKRGTHVGVTLRRVTLSACRDPVRPGPHPRDAGSRDAPR